MNTHPSLSGRALVLGGGGSTGNAWLIGVIAGLRDGGLDATTAEVIVGTSAGSTAAAQITGADPTELYAATLTPPPAQVGSPFASARNRPAVDHLARTDAIIAASADADDMRRGMAASALALDASSDETVQARWRATVAARLPRTGWPAQRVLITAVDARTAEPVMFDRDSGVELVDAVAASCAGGFAYRIGDDAFIDGGYRSNADNADLASGCERVLVLSPFGGRTRLPLTWGLDLATQLEQLRAEGSVVEAIFPDANAEHLFGGNAMNAALRPDAARAGYAQGRERAEQLAGLWG
ncbi:patatin-like phospholipase family protein [Homoserinibacter gongjuensis]|uniref:Patatin n=1 Tax=Homoserinibacter gongjuensis TaxID=1162968 RepID=A0ABQ6JSN9_9MICO|nr:patatin-like phospholipase family protein [Homoserinibacter gongjuensis]GMA90511.1 patatin [Homoserinibacter gongjuensis]